MARGITTVFIGLLMAFAVASSARTFAREEYLSWTEKEVVQIGKQLRKNGRVGGWFDGRIVHTEHSSNYRLLATWLTPELIRASARLAQINDYLSDEDTRALVEEAESVGGTVFLVEIDPREGSGVVPRNWTAILKAKDAEGADAPGLRGESRPNFRKVRALESVFKKDYAYERFWVVFPFQEDLAAILNSGRSVELIVRVAGKEGRVDWLPPKSIRRLAATGMPGTGDPPSTTHRP